MVASRVEIWTESAAAAPKHGEQIQREIEEINNLFKVEGDKMTDTKTDEVIKEAIKEDDFQALMARKKAAQAAQAEVQARAPAMKSVESRPPVSLRFGLAGTGQAGGRIAEVFYKNNYAACAINTARQDLELLELPADCKLHMNYSIGAGGSGKNLEVGRAAIEDSLPAVKSFIAEKLHDVDVYVAAFSLGGGSGAGSAEVLIDTLNEFGKPVVCICALPGSFDDTQSKHNAIQTLSRLADQATAGKINSLILVDNAQIERSYPNLSQADFWKVSNQAIVAPLHEFNSVSARPTTMDALDSADFSLALLESGGCTIFGSNKITKEQYDSNDLALVEAIVDNLENGLLASDFDLKEAQKVGVLVTASEKVLSSIPYSNISFIFKYITETFDSAASFRGIYAVPTDSDDITIHFMFSGLGLPRGRVETLKADAQKNMDALLAKKTNIGGKMSIDLGKDKNLSAADSMMSQIKKNKSAVGKLLGAPKKNVIDRRR